MTMIGSLMGRKKIALINRPSLELVCPDSDIGMEFEFEGVAAKTIGPLTALYFDTKVDPSLHDNGLEFIFKQPMHGEDVVQAVRLMCNAAAEHKYKATLRAGIHVHLDVRDLERTQFIGLLAYYTLFEPLIYAWVGDSREANNFCMPYYKAQGSLDQAIKLTKLLFTDSAAASVYAQQAAMSYSRYAGLNLKCMADLGSVEFRHLRTTTDQEEIIKWINIIFSLKRAAQNVPTSTTQGILDPFRSVDAVPVVMEQIFGREMAWEFMEDPGWVDDFYGLGLPNALQILRTTDDLLGPKKRKAAIKANIHDPWGDAPDPEAGSRVVKSHRAVRDWEKKHFPKEEGQPLAVEPAAQPRAQIIEDEFAQAINPALFAQLNPARLNRNWFDIEQQAVAPIPRIQPGARRLTMGQGGANDIATEELQDDGTWVRIDPRIP